MVAIKFDQWFNFVFESDHLSGVMKILCQNDTCLHYNHEVYVVPSL